MDSNSTPTKETSGTPGGTPGGTPEIRAYSYYPPENYNQYQSSNTENNGSTTPPPPPSSSPGVANPEPTLTTSSNISNTTSINRVANLGNTDNNPMDLLDRKENSTRSSSDTNAENSSTPPPSLVAENPEPTPIKVVIESDVENPPSALQHAPKKPTLTTSKGKTAINSLDKLKSYFASLKGVKNTKISYKNFTINSFAAAVTSYHVDNKSTSENLKIRFIYNTLIKACAFAANSIIAAAINSISGASKSTTMTVLPMAEGAFLGLRYLNNQSNNSNTEHLSAPDHKKSAYLNSISCATAVAASSAFCNELGTDYEQGGCRAALVGAIVPVAVGTTAYYLGKCGMSFLNKSNQLKNYALEDIEDDDEKESEIVCGLPNHR